MTRSGGSTATVAPNYPATTPLAPIPRSRPHLFVARRASRTAIHQIAWSYEIKDDLTGDLRHAVTVVVVDITDKEITTRTAIRGKDRPQTMVFDLDWGRIDDGAWRLQPSGIGIKRPLQVGKEWRSDANAMHLQSGVAYRASGVAKVMGEEQITTAAGTFDTYRIETTVRLVNTRDQTKSSTWTFVFWYAATVNRWVKRKTEARYEGRLRDSYVEELTEYSRKL